MKKLLLSLAMMLGFVAVNAATITIDPETWAGKWTGNADSRTATIDGYTITQNKAESTTDLIEPTEYHMRVYVGSTLTITAPEGYVMKEITFTVDSNSKASSADEVTYSTGWTMVGTPSTSKGSEFGASSEGLSSFTLGTTKQIRVAKIVITAEAGTAVDPVEPDPVEPDPVTPGEDGSVTVESPFAQFTKFDGTDNAVGGYNFSFSKEAGQTDPQVYSNVLRLYTKNTMTISAAKITKVVITLAETANTRYTEFTPSVGAWTKAQAAGDTELTWEGDATTLTFTVTGEKATLATDEANQTKAGQIHIAKIVVYGTSDANAEPDPVEPDPVTPDPVDGDGIVIDPETWANKWTGNADSRTATIDGYTITQEKAASTTDLIEPNEYHMRVYVGSTLTITAPEGYVMKEITFTVDSNSKAASADDVTYSTGWTMVGTPSTSKGSEFGAKSDGLSSFTLTAAKQVRIAKIVIVAEEGTAVDPVEPEPEGDKYELTTTLTTGEYVFVLDGKIAAPAAESNTYGRMNLTNATMDGNYVIAPEKNVFTLTVADGKVTIKDVYNRYYGMDAEHTTSFQFYTELNDGCYYTYEFVGNTIKLTNTLNPTCIVSQTKVTNGTWYTNLAPAVAPEEYNLPSLYKKTNSSSIFEVATDEDAPVVFYNLQGVQVENPAAGIYIRRQGNKTAKVLVK